MHTDILKVAGPEIKGSWQSQHISVIFNKYGKSYLSDYRIKTPWL